MEQLLAHERGECIVDRPQRVVEVFRRDPAVGQQDVTDPDEGGLRGQPLSQHGVSHVEEARVRRPVVFGDAPLLARHVPEVAGEDHDLVVAEHDVNSTARLLRLPLQAVDEPQRAGHVRSPIEQIAQEHQVTAPPGPPPVRTDQPDVAQEGGQAVVLAVDVPDHEDGVGPPEPRLPAFRGRKDRGDMLVHGIAERPVAEREGAGCGSAEGDPVRPARESGEPCVDRPFGRDGQEPRGALGREPANLDGVGRLPYVKAVLAVEAGRTTPARRGESAQRQRSGQRRRQQQDRAREPGFFAHDRVARRHAVAWVRRA